MANHKKEDHEQRKYKAVTLWSELEIEKVGGKENARKIQAQARDAAIIRGILDKSLTACEKAANPNKL
jgi:hypothetical protein